MENGSIPQFSLADNGIFRTTGKKLYGNNQIVREFFQNAHDACVRAGVQSNIEIIVRNYADKSIVIVKDNGIGMDENEILNKFLALGGSSKNNGGRANEVGAFGVGKAVCLGSRFFSVRSNDNFLNLNYIGKRPITKVPYIHGTTVVAVDDKLDKYTIMRWKNEIEHSQKDTAVKFTVVDEYGVSTEDFIGNLNYETDQVSTIVADNATIKITSFEGEIKNSSSYNSGFNFFRINGLVQYSTRSYGRNLHYIFDVETDLTPAHDNYPFTLSRENLRGSCDSVVTDFLRSKDANPLSSVAEKRSAKMKKQNLFSNKTKFGIGKLELPFQNNFSGEIYLDSNDFEKTKSNKPSNIVHCVDYCDYEFKWNEDHTKLCDAIRIACECMTGADSEFGVGITFNSNYNAVNVCVDATSYVCVNYDKFLQVKKNSKSQASFILWFWTILLHECTHFSVADHGELFDSRLITISEIAGELFQQKIPEIKKLIFG